MVMKTGAQVRQVVRPVQGEVLERRFNDQRGQMEYRVSYPGGDASTLERWFLEDELEEVAA